MLIQRIVDQTLGLLFDKAGVNYAPQDIAEYVYDGELAVGALRPDEMQVTSDLRLVAGSRQTLPANGVRLRGVLGNRGRDGALADGPPVRLVSRGPLDDLGSSLVTGFNSRRTDHAGVATATVVKEYSFDEREPKRFDIYPPMPDGDSYISIQYESVPDAYIFTNGALDPGTQETLVSDKYGAALTEWAMYRALSRQDDLTASTVDGNNHYRRFFEMLGITLKADTAASVKNRAQLT